MEVNGSTALTTPSALSGVPEPLARNIAVLVMPGAERAVKEGYPWLLTGSIREQIREGVPRNQAIVSDRKGRFLTVGLYDPHS